MCDVRLANFRPQSSGMIGRMDRSATRHPPLTLAAMGLALWTSLVGCMREPIPCVASLGVGDLVVTEVRGKQAGGGGEQWLEVCNASARRIGLAGVVLVFRRLDGSGERRVLVRDRGLALDPGRCAVVGLFGGVGGGTRSEPREGWDAQDAESAPPTLPSTRYDFSDQWDLSSGLYDAAVLEVLACGNVVDQVVWRDLPDKGSWSLDGRVPPDATANDDASRWCVDDDNPEAGYPGTPGERNRACDG